MLCKIHIILLFSSIINSFDFSFSKSFKTAESLKKEKPLNLVVGTFSKSSDKIAFIIDGALISIHSKSLGVII